MTIAGNREPGSNLHRWLAPRVNRIVVYRAAQFINLQHKLKRTSGIVESTLDESVVALP